MQNYWVKQAADAPVYADLLWSRPENRAHAGKLLIIGGNAHGFAAAAEAYSEATKAGIGTSRVIIPDSLQKTVGRVFEAGEYAPSTPSGSFSQKALAELLPPAQWADGVLVAGDLGRNSETAILLEKFVTTYEGQLSITQDAADYFTKTPAPILERQATLLVVSFAQLQKFTSAARFATPFIYDMNFLTFIEALHNFSTQHVVSIITKHHDTVFVAHNGAVSTTSLQPDLTPWRVRTAAHASVWWLQNPNKIFEALTTSLVAP